MASGSGGTCYYMPCALRWAVGGRRRPGRAAGLAHQPGGTGAQQAVVGAATRPLAAAGAGADGPREKLVQMKLAIILLAFVCPEVVRALPDFDGYTKFPGVSFEGADNAPPLRHKWFPILHELHAHHRP
jgi:hypothetical protein